MQDYSDIINMPHYQFKNHPHMPRAKRAAQFAAFQALSGYEACIDEARRITDEAPDLTDEEKAIISWKLEVIAHAPQSQVSFLCFFPDEVKAGGRYEEITGIVDSVLSERSMVLLRDGPAIPFSIIVNIDADCISSIESA